MLDIREIGPRIAIDEEAKVWRDSLIAKREALFARADRPQFLIEGVAYVRGANVLNSFAAKAA